MGDVIPHFCTGAGCEAMHGRSGESDDVRIAKINADRDVRVAELSRSEMRDLAAADIETTEITADAVVEQTEIMAEAAVDEAVVENEVLEEITNPEPEPVQVEISESGDETESDGVSAPPEIEPSSDDAKSKGWWSGYR